MGHARRGRRRGKRRLQELSRETMATGAGGKDPCPMLCPLAGFQPEGPQSWAGRGGGRVFLQRRSWAPLALRTWALGSTSFPRAMPASSCTCCLLGIAPRQLQQDGAIWRLWTAGTRPLCGTSMQSSPGRGRRYPPGSHPPSPAAASEPRVSMGWRRTGREAGRGTQGTERGRWKAAASPTDESLVSAPKFLAPGCAPERPQEPTALSRPRNASVWKPVPLGIPCLSGRP